MNSIICLALSCLLVGLLYVFMRQLFAAQDRKISDLTQLVASVASELQQNTNPVQPALPPQNDIKRVPMPEGLRLPERVTVSDDSDSESEDESCNDAASEDSEQSEEETELVKAPKKDIEIETEDFELKNTLDIVEDISIVLDLNEGTKTINLFEDPPKPNYEKLTVKDLKELVAKQGGPASLKTKKDLVDFLEKR